LVDSLRVLAVVACGPLCLFTLPKLPSLLTEDSSWDSMV
jgi:hypothetical protein